MNIARLEGQQRPLLPEFREGLLLRKRIEQPRGHDVRCCVALPAVPPRASGTSKGGLDGSRLTRRRRMGRDAAAHGLPGCRTRAWRRTSACCLRSTASPVNQRASDTAVIDREPEVEHERVDLAEAGIHVLHIRGGAQVGRSPDRASERRRSESEGHRRPVPATSPRSQWTCPSTPHRLRLRGMHRHPRACARRVGVPLACQGLRRSQRTNDL